MSSPAARPGKYIAKRVNQCTHIPASGRGSQGAINAASNAGYSYGYEPAAPRHSRRLAERPDEDEDEDSGRRFFDRGAY